MTRHPRSRSSRRRPVVLVVLSLVLAPGTAAAAAEPQQVAARLQPSDFTYLGAFKLPPVDTELPAVWDWGGAAMTYYPAGDPGGGDDAFPGSLFATGIDTENYVSEISIPSPSTSRNLGALDAAATLQQLADVRQGLFAAYNELPRVGIEYLPAQAGQAAEHLHLAWGQHFHDDPLLNIGPTHAWCDLDLENPNTRGAWWIGDADAAAQGFIYSVNGYLFAIADDWAEINAGGMKLATGRFRDGGWSGMGPSLVAYGPWLDGDPPAPGAELAYRTLLLYSHTRGDDPADRRLNGYSHADAWSGGAWITAGGKSAVVFAGTKGSGYNWYGFYTPAGVAPAPLFPEGAPCAYTAGDLMCYQPDGVTPCTQEDMQPCAGAGVDMASRGWWSSRFDAQFLLYDPDDLAAVAAGTMEPHDPQPYATLDVDEHLFLNATMPDVTTYIGHGDQRNIRLGEPAYDRANGLLYVPELFADEYRPLIHVFRVEAGAVPETHALTVTRSGTGGGTVTSDPAGISCGGDCSHDYSAGTAVTLVATPAAGSTFAGWSGGCSGTGACVLTMNAATMVGARFDATAAGCVPGPANLCLSGNRFRVAVDWRDFSGNAGSGQVVPFGSADSGLFWFFAADNWEMLVKVLDGCSFNGHFWVFSAATTNVEYTLRVTDTESGAVRTYMNPLGNAAAATTDTAAFATCPRAIATPAR